MNGEFSNFVIKVLVDTLAAQVSLGLCCKHGARPRGVTQLGD